MKALWFIPLIIVAAVVGFGFLITGLWNGIMPEVFGLGSISFWQAIGMLILGRLLFGGFRKRRHWNGYNYKYAYAYCQPNRHKTFKETHGEDTIANSL